MLVEPFSDNLIYLVIGLGLCIAVWRPYWALLFVVIWLIGGNSHRMVATRTAYLGPYLNLTDAFVFIGLIALGLDCLYRKVRLRFPKPIFFLFLAIGIAFLQSVFTLGWTYETLRALRWAFQLYIAFFIAANMVDSPQRSRDMLGAVFCGICLAALLHMVYVVSAYRTYHVTQATFHLVRTIAYSGGWLAAPFVLTAFVYPLPSGFSRKLCIIFIAALFLVSIVMTQTRSCWLAMMAGCPVLVYLFTPNHFVRQLLYRGRYFAAACLAVFILGIVVAPQIRLSDMISEKLLLFTKKDPSEAFTATRLNQFHTEINCWKKGTLFLGQGLVFYQTIPNYGEKDDYIAFGHLGYVTYLSQLGLFGLWIYGIYFPMTVLRDGRSLWMSARPVDRYLGLLATASIIHLSLMFLMSSSFLEPWYFGPGALYGAVWARSHTRLLPTQATRP